MGLLKKIKSKPHPKLRSIYHRRKKTAAPELTSASASSDDDKTWEYRVTSNPKEYSRESEGSFNWLTRKVDDFDLPDCTPAVPDCTTAEDTLSEVDTSYDPKTSIGDIIGWTWLLSCWGPVAANKTDDPTYQSSYDEDGSGDSSQPSLSRVDQVLKLAPMQTSVSDITSVASMDDSDSDSDTEDGH